MEHSDFNNAKISEELTPISKAFDRLERNISYLETSFNELADKIKPVLGPEYIDGLEEVAETVPEMSNVARFVENHSDRIAFLCNYVSSIRNRVEL